MEYFTFREIPLLNIQATLACWCPTPTSHSITHFGNNSPSRLIQLGFAAKYIVQLYLRQTQCEPNVSRNAYVATGCMPVLWYACIGLIPNDFILLF